MMLQLKLDRLVMERGFGKSLKRDPAVIAAEEQIGQAILGAANASLKHKGEPYPDYKMFSEPVGASWHVTVVTDSNHAKYSCAKHNTLVRVTGGVR